MAETLPRTRNQRKGAHAGHPAGGVLPLQADQQAQQDGNPQLLKQRLHQVNCSTQGARRAQNPHKAATDGSPGACDDRWRLFRPSTPHTSRFFSSTWTTLGFIRRASSSVAVP